MGRSQAPAGWKSFYDTIKQMRAATEAPVDTMGCHKLAAPESSPKDARFQTLVALMLSSQTRDEITAGAMRRLHTLPLTVSSIINVPESSISELIYPVGFYRRKAENIKKVASILQDQYDSDIPDTLERLKALPGVGPKMSYLALQFAWGKNDGIGVDVHVHRITNRIGWVKTETPEETRLALEDWLPQELWPELNPLLVGFGQTICLSTKPKCVDCFLKDVCPSSTAMMKAPTKKRAKL